MLSYIFLTSFVAVINSALMPRCPSNTTQSYYDKKICYSFVTEAKNFADAETYCNSQNGNLVVIPNQFINSFVWCESKGFLIVEEKSFQLRLWKLLDRLITTGLVD